MRVTADTNIWVSAFNFNGKPRRLIDLAVGKEVELAVSEAIFSEVRRVLRNQFGWSPDRIQAAEAVMQEICTRVTPRVELDVVKDDPTDNRIVECASASGSEYIVTGDRDLLRLGVYDSIRMVTVSDFLEIVRSAQRAR